MCNTAFTTASGVSHHLERSACPNARHLSRDKIHEAIRQRDPGNSITTPQIGWYDEPESMYQSTSSAWNGSAWECALCHRNHNSRRALDQHLNSSVHQRNIYHCPKRDCAREFATLAGLLQHLESEACGYIRFEKMQRQIGSLLTSNRMIAL